MSAIVFTLRNPLWLMRRLVWIIVSRVDQKRMSAALYTPDQFRMSGNIHKDRLSLLHLLLGPHELYFEFNEDTFQLLQELKQSAAIIDYLRNTCTGIVVSETELDKLLQNLPTKNKNINTIHRRINEAAGITWYHNQKK